jgi:hypothetical protein
MQGAEAEVGRGKRAGRQLRCRRHTHVTEEHWITRTKEPKKASGAENLHPIQRHTYSYISARSG